MHYVILRDDDTHALTPPACLERLYRPFLERGLPVTLAVIPEVRTDVRLPNGQPEGFLAAGRPTTRALAPLAESHELLNYLHSESGFHVAQHGCHHDRFEFGITDHAELARRLERGARRLREAGFARPSAFVAPYDRLSRAAFIEVAERFEVISTGWFEARRTPVRWWTAFARKKITGRPHWRAGGATLLSHPGCLLSYHRPYADMLESVRRTVEANQLTVLVTHWWEYFRDGVADEDFIANLHEAGLWLASRRDVCVTTFDRVAAGEVPLNPVELTRRDSVARPAPPVAS
jgi:peptidoglycan/xylan/chitin deacetylase (PgdA/CDA1 family)